MVGRLDMKTGEIKLTTSPTAQSNPYGMVMNSKGVPYFVEFGANKVASIDPRDPGNPRIRIAARREPAAARGHYAGRRHLVFGLFPRLSGAVRHQDGNDEGMAVAGRAEVAAIRGSPS